MSPSPTHPSLRPPPSLPTCFLPPVPVFHGAAVPPCPCLATLPTSLGSTSSQTASAVSGRAQQRAAGCWETLSFHHVFPVGFLATFSGTFSSLLPPRILPNGLPQPVPPIPTLARPLPLFPTSFPSVDPFPCLFSIPCPVSLSQVSVYPAPGSLPRPHHSLKPVSLPHPTRSLQNRFLSPHTLSASLYRLILPLQTSGASPVSLPSHSHPSLPTSGASVLQPPAAPSAHPARLARPVPISPPLGSP